MNHRGWYLANGKFYWYWPRARVLGAFPACSIRYKVLFRKLA